MTIRRKNLINILFDQNIPLIEYYLKQIAEDYNISFEELESKYIKPFKIVKKRNTNKKGRHTNYSMFLADKEVENEIRKKFPNIKFGDISKQKSKVWKVMSKKDKDIYKKKAAEYNKKKQYEEDKEEEEKEKKEEEKEDYIEEHEDI